MDVAPAGLTAERLRFGVRARRWRAARPPAGLLGVAAGVAILTVLPIVYLALRAATGEVDLTGSLLRPRTLAVVVNTASLAAAVALATALIGLPIAWLTARSDLPGRRLWAVLTTVPLAIPSYVTAFAVVAAFGPSGLVSDALAPLGVELPSIYGLPGAWLVLTLACTPYVVISARAALARFDPAQEEAARSLGDPPVRAFSRVTLPVLTPAIAAGVLLAILYTLSDFGAVGIMRFDTFARSIQLQYRASFDRSLASVLALLLVGVALAVALAEARLRRRAATDAPVRAVPPPARLGRWRWPALLLVGTVVGLSLALPAVTIGWWLLRGLANAEPVRLVPGATLNSLVVGLGAALLAVALALPLALLVTRWRSRFAQAVERLSYAGYAIPGIALALAVVFFASNVVPWAYQTLGLFVLAYAIRFLPQAVGPARQALGTIGPRLEDAARSLGERPWGVFRSITLPLLRPGLAAGAALVFLTTVKELPMALLLAPIGFETLATTIWGAATEGLYARAAAPAAILMGISALTVALLLRGEEVHG